MKLTIDCPVCDGKTFLNTERKRRTYRNDNFEIYEHFYQCEKCSYSFTNEDTDKYNLQVVLNQYREKNNIPFPEQLTYLRENYGLSQSKMSEILGFGPNQYRLYENGDMPVGGNATVLSIIINPAEFKNILLKKRSHLTDKKWAEVIKRIDNLIDGDFNFHLKNELFPINIIPNVYTGHYPPSFEKFAYMVIFFLANASYKTRLNKLLFYADFAHYKYYGNSISGCKYAAIDMGSVPDKFAFIYSLMETEGFIRTELTEIKQKEYEKFVSSKNFINSLFKESEIEILTTVLEKFKFRHTEDIIKVCHDELAWIENEKSKSLIDYSVYAPQLKSI